MSKRLTLSLDAMGGDQAPRMVVEGIDLILGELPDVDYLLFGDETLINPLLDEFGPTFWLSKPPLSQGKSYGRPEEKNIHVTP